MCIVIDANTWSCVFNLNDEKHKEFKPVLNWLLNTKEKSKIVYGGTKFLKELEQSGKYRSIFKNFEKMGKVVKANKDNVDFYQEQIENFINDSDFDDPHILAIFDVTKCKLLCSNDKRMYKFIKKRDYPKEIKPNRIKIYTGKNNSGLLCNDNIANICNN